MENPIKMDDLGIPLVQESNWHTVLMSGSTGPSALIDSFMSWNDVQQMFVVLGLLMFFVDIRICFETLLSGSP